MSIEIAPLDQAHAYTMSHLIAGYLSSSSDGTDGTEPSPDQLRHSEHVLNRLMADDSSTCYVFLQDQEPIGFILLAWSFSLSKGCPVVRVEALFVSSKHRKKGAGRKLLEHAFSVAAANNAARLQLDTDDDNEPARNLYSRLGFEQIQGKGVYMAFL